MMTRTIGVCLGLVATALVNSIFAADDQAAQVKTDRLLIQAQRICPVTGEDLRSMGGPVKAKVGNATVFLCCKGCLGRQLNAQHWATVQTNLRFAHLALAQQICPVTGKNLLSMGGPVPTQVGKQTAFLCCKGCINKQVNPEFWEQVQTNLKTTQKLCPVRDVELGDEAVPVVVKGRAIYVCCDSGYCIRKVEANPDKYLGKVDKLLAKNLVRRTRAPNTGERE